MAWDGEHLWVNDDSTDTIYKLNPSDGSIISSFPAPGPRPRGLTWDSTHLWCLESSSDSIFKLDSNDGSVLKSIPAPGNIVLGLTWDGQYLWSAYYAGWSSEVNQVDTTDGTVIRSFLCYANGLAFDGEFLWGVKSTGGVYKGFVEKYNYSNGMKISYFRTPGYYPTGLTFDGKYFWLADCGIDTLFKIEIVTTSVEMYKIDPSLHASFKLHNYPNPFNQQTIILYELPYDSKVCLRIFNINGQLIKTLEDEEKKIGLHWIYWDGKSNMGRYVPSGTYFCQVETEKFSKSNKMTIIR